MLGPGVAEGAERSLARYGEELAYEVSRRSDEGERALRITRERTRVEDDQVHEQRFHQAERELRSTGTGGGASATSGSEGGAFVSPYFLLGDWTPFRGVARVFAEAVFKEGMPPFGINIYIPRWSSAASASQQVEGSAVSESSPAAEYGEAEVKTIAGQVFASEQLRDRGYKTGGSMDQILFSQIHRQIDEQVEKYVIAQGLAGANEISSSASLGENSKAWPEDLKDISKGRHEITAKQVHACVQRTCSRRATGLDT